MKARVLKDWHEGLKYTGLAVGVLLLGVSGALSSYFIDGGRASAAAVRCFAATSDAHADEIDCNESGIKDTLLDFTHAGSLDELADRCFAISIDWAEIECEEASEANQPRCIKENTDEGRYVDVECAAFGVAHDYQERKCYAINRDNIVLELECNGDEWLSYIGGTYPGGRYEDSGGSTPGEYQNAPITCTGGDISDPNNCPIVGRLVLAINVLSAAVGLIVIAVIVFSGIQYSSSRDDPQVVAAAKGRIMNAIIALVVFIFSWTILQWLIPGGVLK